MNILEIANNQNKKYIKEIQNLPPITYDRLTCPKCGSPTVTCVGYSWCPSTVCDYGNELKLGLMTKFL